MSLVRRVLRVAVCLINGHDWMWVGTDRLASGGTLVEHKCMRCDLSNWVRTSLGGEDDARDSV